MESDDAPALLILVASRGGGLLVLHRHAVDVVVHAMDAAWRGERVLTLHIRAVLIPLFAGVRIGSGISLF